MAVVLILCAGVALAADPVVTNVTLAQRAGTRVMDIYYDVSDADSTTLTVYATVSTNDGAMFDLRASSFSDGGATRSYGTGVTPGTNRWIVWNAGADAAPTFCDKVRVRVTADGTATEVLHRATHAVQRVACLACCGAGAGSATSTTIGARAATATIRAARVTTSGFVV